MRTDVLQLVRDAGPLTHVVILTYNIDFQFVQHVLRPQLRKCGHPSLVIFADAHRSAESFARGATPAGLGVRYRVVPVAMPAGASFHPKAVFLSGSTRGTLLVGSGNLSFGGWRENGEIWLRRATDRHGTATFAYFQAYLRRIVARVPLSDVIVADIDAAFEGATRPWAQDMEDPGGLVGRVGDGPSLLDHMREVMPARTFSELAIASPYFDKKAHAVTALRAAFGHVDTQLLVPRTGNNLRAAAAAALPPQVTLSSTTFTHAAESGNPREGFVHAKFYALTSDSRVDLFLGSANASRAALLSSGGHGNAELLAHVEMSAAEYRNQFLAELAITTTPPLFAAPSDDDADDEDEQESCLQILAARLNGGALLVGFRATDGVRVTACVLDGVEAEDFTVQAQVLEVQAPGALPRTVYLLGTLAGETVTSPLCWIDQEEQLQTSSAARTLADELRNSPGGATPDLGVWTNILMLFCNHLEALPPPSAAHATTHEPPTGIGPTFTKDDVFVDEARLHFGPITTNAPGGHARATLLQQLMLRWFHGTRNVPTGEDSDDGSTPAKHPGEDPASPPPHADPARAGRRRFDRLVARLQTSMIDPDFLRRRPVATLAADLCLAAGILRTGLRERWLDTEQFFSVTHDIWRALFLSTIEFPTFGWIEIRHANTSDPAGFRRTLGTERVTAALAAWALTDLPSARESPRHARFVLAALLSVARNEWLWVAGDLQVVANELSAYLAITREGSAALAGAWRSLIRRGRALGRLERLLRTRPLAEWRARVTQTQLACGELLWQDRAGWCITTAACNRLPGVKVPVLKLQSNDEPVQFLATSTVPIRGLVEGPLAELIAEILTEFE